MKHLKAYKIFESTEQDLKDILLELEDMGYRVIYEDDVNGAITGKPGNVKAIVVRDVIRSSDWEGLPWSELKEYALRIKGYLGDKYLSFMFRFRDVIKPRFPGVSVIETYNPYQTIELNDDTEIDGRLWSFVIKYRE
jgi:hypothetical protein